MKITQIDVKNFQGLHYAALAVSEPVLLVSGGNGAGKSSLLDAIAMAYTGNPSRVTLKRDIKILITDGAKKGSISVHTSEGQFGTELPPTKTAVHFTGNNFLPFALDASAFAALDDKARRKLLFELTGASAKPQVIAEKLKSRGISTELIEQVKPLLLSGFPAAAEHAKNLISEARGAWKQVTGEVYGSAKAAIWEPEDTGIVINPEQLAKAKTDLAQLDADLNEALETLGARKSEAAQAQQQADKVAALQETAAMLDRRKIKLDRDKADLATWQKQVEQAREAGGTKKEGLIHDMACALDESLAVYPDLNEKIAPLLEAYTSEYGPIGGSEGNPELAKRLPEFLEIVTKLKGTIANSERDLKASQDAVTALEALKATPAPSAAAIENAEAAINELRQQRDKAKAAVTAMQDAEKSIAERESTIKTAAELHTKVLWWSEIADALSPTGIPAEILQSALSPVNELLTELSKMAGWKEARITGDIEITYGERLYGLLSESEKWRTDTLLSIAVASLSGLKFVTLDRFDVLEPAARPQALKLLLQCASKELLDQAIMAGTMKEPMAKLPKGMQQAWIAEGVIVNAEDLAA